MFTICFRDVDEVLGQALNSGMIKVAANSGGIPPGLEGIPPGVDGIPPGVGGIPPGVGGIPLVVGGIPPGVGGIIPGVDEIPPTKGNGVEEVRTVDDRVVR